MIDQYEFSCEEHSYWIGVLTLGLVYLPALNIASGLYGTRTAGLLGLTSGIIMAISGAVILPGFYIWEFDVMSLYQCIWMWLLQFLGVAYIALGFLLLRKKSPSRSPDPVPDQSEQKSETSRTGKEREFKTCQKCLLLEGWYLLVHNLHFPVVILVSPVLIIIYEFLSVLKPENEFIENQSKLATRGECGLETSPQLILQLYSIMVSWHPLTFAQKYSIATSCLSLRFCSLIIYRERIPILPSY